MIMKKLLFALALSAAVLSGCSKPDNPDSDKTDQQQQDNGGNENNGGEGNNGGENEGGNGSDGASFTVESAGKMIQIGTGDEGFTVLKVECKDVTPTVETSDPSWLTATISTTELRIEVARNTSGNDRIGSVIITPGNLEKVTIKVLQPEYEVPELSSITGKVEGGIDDIVFDDGDRFFFGFWKDGTAIKKVSLALSDTREGTMGFDLRDGELPLDDGAVVYMIYARNDSYGAPSVEDDGSASIDFSGQLNQPQNVLLGKGTVSGGALEINFKRANSIVRIGKISGFAHGESIATLRAAGLNVITDATVVLEGGELKLKPGTANDILRFKYEQEFSETLDNTAFGVLPTDSPVNIHISAVCRNSNYLYEYIAENVSLGAGKTIDLGNVALSEVGVKLYSSGPFWRYCNAGADKPEDFGGWYSWGNTESHDDLDYWWGKEYGEPLYANYTGTPGSTLTGSFDARSEYDAAYINCGGSWETPTKDQLDCLRRYCDITYGGEGGGVTFSGKGNYAGCSIFVPYAESGAKGGKVINAALNCYLWSRTYSKEQYGFKVAWSLWLSRYADEESGNWSIYENYVQCGCSVRPVSY